MNLSSENVHGADLWPQLRAGCFILIVLLPLSALAATTLTGRVVNRSTGRNSPGDKVALYIVSQSMHERQRTTSNAHGNFKFEIQHGETYLIAAVHGGVSYHTQALTGASPVEVSVYDKATNREVVGEDADTLFFESDSGSIKVTEFLVLANRSDPPRTLSLESTVEFELPRGATLDSVAIEPPGTLPLLLHARTDRDPLHYSIDYPIRPGLNKVRLIYHIPHSPSIEIKKQFVHAVGAMDVVVPTSLQFESEDPDRFVREAQEKAAKYRTTNLLAGETVTFTLSQAKSVGIVSDLSTIDEPSLSSDSPQQAKPVTNHKLFAGYELVMIVFTIALLAAGALMPRRTPFRREDRNR